MSEEAVKRGSEKTRGQYGAVDFSYDTSSPGDVIDNCNGDEGDKGDDDQQVPPEDPYVCPSELQGHDVLLPESDKQAQIIERTAVFVARQGNQMEIVLKAKQTGNPLFAFLNYDHDLNPFYKLVVKLIRQGRYVPKIRPSKCDNLSAVQYEPNKSINEDVYELKLPKVDISNTAYASLINKFKKFNEASQQSTSVETSQATTETEVGSTDSRQETQTDVAPPDSQSECCENTSVSNPDSLKVSTGPTSEGDSIAVEEYEQCYQEYYKHYYAHYYSQFSEQHLNLTTQPGASLPSDQQVAIVNQAAKAAAVAASAAVNAMHQARTKKNAPVASTLQHFPAMTSGEKAIIDKMAEYVTRNGPEFEELVVCQKKNDPRFGFLNADHLFHEYYLSRQKNLDAKFCGVIKGNESFELSVPIKPAPKLNDGDEGCSNTTLVTASSPLDDQAMNSLNPLPADRFSSISFKVTRPCSSSRLRVCNTELNNISNTRSPGTLYDSVNADLKTVASCPILQDSHSPPVSPIHIPSMTLAEQQCQSENKTRKHRSNSPPQFSLLGIACAYNSDSSASSSPDHSPARISPAVSPKPVIRSSPSSSETSPPTVNNFATTPAVQLLKNIRGKSPVTSINNKTPTSSIEASAPPSRSSSTVDGPLAETSPHSAILGDTTIEEMLDIAHIPSTVRQFASSNSSSGLPTDDEQLQLNRRKRAALLVARLKQTSAKSPVKDTAGVASQHQLEQKLVPPPPAPDSVPAAVAHAVVASLKRRHETALSTAEKERKRHRSPPAAYALPRSSKSSDHDSFRERRDSAYYRQKKHSRY